MSMMKEKIKNFWQKNDQKILFFLSFALLAVVSFNAGRTYESSVKPAEIKMSINQNPMLASNPKQERIQALGEAVERSGAVGEIGKVLAQENNSNGSVPPVSVDGGNQNSSDSNVVENKNCALIGSKNSDKYHKADCSYAKKIKAENRVCFSSPEEAQGKGYQPAQCCHK